MLFHVTITHSDTDCPGRQSGGVPDLTAAADEAEHPVTQRSLVWGAPCVLWGEPEHVAFALLEAVDVETIERYLQPLMPTTWATRVLPVLASSDQITAVRRALAGSAAEPEVAQAEQIEPRDAADVDTLKGVSVDVPEEPGPPAEPDEGAVDKRVTRPIPQPTPPAPEEPQAPTPATPDTSSVTRVIDRRSLLEGMAAAPAQQPDQLAVVSGLGADEPPPPEQPSPSESSTVILEPKAQRLPGLRLIASSGPAHGAVFHVGEDGATLGRLPENTICLTDGRLSRHHARIDFRDDAFWITDLGSQNGTLVNDRPVTEASRLQAGDAIELGTTQLRVMLDADD
jgi:FHA domain